MNGKWMLAAGVLMLCAAAGRAQDPQPRGNVSVFDGQDQFATYCASCHGPGAKGDGVVGATLKRRPPDLTTFAARNGGKFDADLVFQIVDGRKPIKGHGGGDMPVWGDAFSRSVEGSTPEAVQARITAIVRWLERIQRDPSQ